MNEQLTSAIIAGLESMPIEARRSVWQSLKSPKQPSERS